MPVTQLIILADSCHGCHRLRSGRRTSRALQVYFLHSSLDSSHHSLFHDRVRGRTLRVAILPLTLPRGANTDRLGRRWFLVGGNLICVVGHIVVGTAKNPSSVIAGMAIAGFGGANCQMAAFALSELLPNKWRHIGVVLADVATFLAVIVAPASARYGYETGSWRWNFYTAAIAQFLSFVGLLLLYFPPAHPLNQPWKQVVKDLDYLGIWPPSLTYTRGRLLM